jgi:hypothetical protein
MEVSGTGDNDLKQHVAHESSGSSNELEYKIKYVEHFVYYVK